MTRPQPSMDDPMQPSRRRISRALLCLGVPIVPSLASAQGAQNFPNRPIRLVVASAAGGILDHAVELGAGSPDGCFVSAN